MAWEGVSVRWLGIGTSGGLFRTEFVTSDTITSKELLDYVRNYPLLKKNSAPSSYLVC
jgi:hypothetical protein